MKRHSITMTFLFLLLCGASFAQSNSTKGEDEKAIRANLEQMIKGWNMKSGEEFAKPFAEDSDYVVVNGMHLKGRAANAAGHQQIFDTFYKDTDVAGTVEQIRFCARMLQSFTLSPSGFQKTTEIKRRKAD